MQIKQINKGFKEYKKVNFSAKKSAENVVYSPKRTKTDIVELTTKKTNELWQEIKEYFEAIFDRELITHSSSKRKKIRVLTEADIPHFYAKQIANYDKKDFEKVMELILLGVEPTCIEDIKELNEEQFAQAKDILQNREITDKDLINLSRLRGKNFKEAMELLDSGIDKECVVLHSRCTQKEKKDIKKLLEKGEKPQEAILLRKRPLQTEEKSFFKELIKTGLPIQNINSLIEQPNLHKKAIELFADGINEDLLEDFAKLSEEEERRNQELKSIGLDSVDIIELCTLPEEDYKKAKKLIEEDIHTNFILPIIHIEKGKNKNKEYEDLLKKGYGKNTAFSIYCLDSDEKEIFKNFLKKHSIVLNYLKNNYQITCLGLQQQNTDEITFTKEFYKNGAKIILTDTLNTNGELKQYRSEKYQDGTISTSIKAGQKSAFIKRDKNKTITSITEFLKDRKGSVYGVLHSERSKDLLGAFNTTYYDINDFICDTTPENINKDIKEATTNKGIELSKVTKKEDGAIEYNENTTNNGFKTNRLYKENKTTKEYSYSITNESGEEVLSINTYWKKNEDGTVTNIINGNEYTINYDENKKEITIQHKDKKRKINLDNKLAKYPKERLWAIAKTLDVKTLIKIDEAVKKWQYCPDVDSSYTKNTKTLDSGDDKDIISHEIGHINAFDLRESADFEAVKECYLKEMKSFEERNTFIEQEIIEYFSPRAKNEESDGINEFIAESNLLFNSFGHQTDIRILGIRSQLLAKYFPETIARIAEVTGINSKAPLI